MFASLVSLILCFVMLCSTTFAWFTDVASSNGNIIQSGKLHVGMYWADGEDDLSSAGWNDASVGSIFDADGWEPGHIDSKHIRIVNEGNLAFKYDLVLAAEGEVSALADVIDVYVAKYDTALVSTIDEPTPIGTLAELLSSSKSLVSGELSPNDPDTDDEISEKIITVTFKMREGLGKEYQNLNLGSGFSVKLLATQLGYDGGGSDDEGDQGDNEGTGGDSSDTEDEGPIVLISNEEFVYGAYFDLDSTGAMKTSGAYGSIKTSHTLLPAQNITVKVEDSDLSLYYVTIGYFDADGKYKGKSGLLKMTNGEITISATSMTSSHFRVNVYKYNGGFPKVPETATINVYGEKPVVKNWEGKTIGIVGDSISAGSYPSMLGTLSGATIDNNAVSGSLLANKGKTMVSQLSGISDDADLIIIFGGTNDYWHKSVQIGELGSTDSTTFLGALDYYLSYLKTNHPDAEYLFVFPADQTFGGDSSDTDFGYGTLGDFRAAFIEFCTARGVNHLDLGTSEYDCSVHSGDGVHPNAAGHQVIAEAIYQYIADISPKAK